MSTEDTNPDAPNPALSSQVIFQVDATDNTPDITDNPAEPITVVPDAQAQDTPDEVPD